MTRLKEAEALLRCVLSECDIRSTNYARAMSIEHFLGQHKDEPEDGCEDCVPTAPPGPRSTERARKVKYISFAEIAKAESQLPRALSEDEYRKALDKIVEDLNGK